MAFNVMHMKVYRGEVSLAITTSADVWSKGAADERVGPRPQVLGICHWARRTDQPIKTARAEPSVGLWAAEWALKSRQRLRHASPVRTARTKVVLRC